MLLNNMFLSFHNVVILYCTDIHPVLQVPRFAALFQGIGIRKCTLQKLGIGFQHRNFARFLVRGTWLEASMFWCRYMIASKGLIRTKSISFFMGLTFTQITTSTAHDSWVGTSFLNS